MAGLKPPTSSHLWRNRDYLLLWSGQVVSTLGSAATTVVYPLLILAMTGSPTVAGLAGALRAAPYLVLSLPVGALIDRWDRKRVMILCDLGRGFAAISIVVAIAFNALTLWQIYAAILVEGSLFVFFNIAEVAALPRVVPATQLPQAAAQNEAGFGAANILGPSLGTVLYQAFGRAIPFLADAVSYAVSVLSLVRIGVAFNSDRTIVRRDLAREVAEGLRWLWDNRLIRHMAFLTGGLNLVNAASPLVIIVLAKQMGAGDAQVGMIFSIAGMGGIVGSLMGGQVQRRFGFGQVIVATVWLNALFFALYAIVPSYFLLGVVGALIYATGPIYNVVQFSYRLTLIPDELQGRVNSTFRLLAFGFMPLGAALSGVLLERFGAVPTVMSFAGWSLLLALLTSLNRHVREAAPIERTKPA